MEDNESIVKCLYKADEAVGVAHKAMEKLLKAELITPEAFAKDRISLFEALGQVNRNIGLAMKTKRLKDDPQTPEVIQFIKDTPDNLLPILNELLERYAKIGNTNETEELAKKIPQAYETVIQQLKEIAANV